jgi:hypothetical protein
MLEELLRMPTGESLQSHESMLEQVELSPEGLIRAVQLGVQARVNTLRTLDRMRKGDFRQPEYDQRLKSVENERRDAAVRSELMDMLVPLPEDTGGWGAQLQELAQKQYTDEQSGR